MYPKKRSELSKIRIAVAQTARRMLGAPYRLGGWEPKAGFDCFSYWYWFYSQLGAALPDSSGKYSRDSYVRQFARNPAGAKAAMSAALKSLGRPVSSAYLLPADLCLLDRDSNEINTAIYLGSGHMLSCDARTGVIIFPARRLGTCIKEARRVCPRLYHI